MKYTILLISLLLCGCCSEFDSKPYISFDCQEHAGKFVSSEWQKAEGLYEYSISEVTTTKGKFYVHGCVSSAKFNDKCQTYKRTTRIGGEIKYTDWFLQIGLRSYQLL